MRKHVRAHGKINLSAYFANYKKGDKVTLFAEPAVQAGIYHLRFHGKVGTVVQKRGGCYEVRIFDGDKAKTVIVHPVHLKPSSNVMKARITKKTVAAPKQAVQKPALPRTAGRLQPLAQRKVV
jgi:large subunit ribosomal protein L21e